MLTVLTKPNKRKATAKDTSSETNQNLSIESRGIQLSRITVHNHCLYIQLFHLYVGDATSDVTEAA